MKSYMAIGVVAGVALVLILLVVGRSRWAPVQEVRPASRGAKADTQGDNRKEADWTKNSDITVGNGVFSDPKFRLSGKVPTGWVFLKAMRRGENETSLHFVIPAHKELVLTVYFRANENTDAVSAMKAREILRDAIAEKTSQRLDGGYESYKVRPEVEMKAINGQPAVSWVADFVRYQAPAPNSPASVPPNR